MNRADEYLNPSEVAARLGVSAKALRLYEQRGLIAPVRTAAGWRTYGRNDMARLTEIVALRALGLSLAQVARVLKGDRQCLELALVAHQANLQNEVRRLGNLIEDVREIRAALAQGEAPVAEELARLAQSAPDLTVAFDLPWPWGGERFELRGIRPLNYIIGPLGSGKTRLAQALANNLPGATFVGPDRLADEGRRLAELMETHPMLKARVDPVLEWLVDDGATLSAELISLLVALESEPATVLVVDMVEQGLDHPTQEALMAYLRRRGPDARPLFLMTRSSVILDLEAVTHDEMIILCPANHSPPSIVAPYPGTPGYDSVATCLASPDVRARTQGVIAWLPPAA